MFEAGHISFDEMWVLLQDNEEVQYIPMGVPNTIPIIDPYPIYPWDGPQYTTNVKDNQRIHIEGRGDGTPESH